MTESAYSRWGQTHMPVIARYGSTATRLRQFLSVSAERGTALTAVLFVSSALTVGATGVPASPGGDQTAAARLLRSNAAATGLAARAIAEMKTVRTVRSSGLWGGWRFTGACVMGDPRASISFGSATVRVQKIFISKPVQKDWERSRRGLAPWGKWQPQATGAGDFNFPLLLPLACPRSRCTTGGSMPRCSSVPPASCRWAGVRPGTCMHQWAGLLPTPGTPSWTGMWMRAPTACCGGDGSRFPRPARWGTSRTSRTSGSTVPSRFPRPNCRATASLARAIAPDRSRRGTRR
jgi:hypothetical protein